MIKLLIMSDTHGLYQKEMMNVFGKEKPNVSVHAGDYCVELDEIKKIFNYVVDGNNDIGGQEEIIFKIGKYRFLLLHGHHYFSFKKEKWHSNLRELGLKNQVDVVIFGHEHIPLIDENVKPFLINPGSFSLPRNGNVKNNMFSYVVCSINNDQINFSLKHL